VLSCHDIHEMTSDYLEKRLSLKQRINYRLHMFFCHDCQRFLAQFRTTIRTLRGLRLDEPSAQTVDAQVEALLKQRRDQK